MYGSFLKWWVSPTTMGFLTKNDHFGVFGGGYHHLREHPYDVYLFHFLCFQPPIFSRRLNQKMMKEASSTPPKFNMEPENDGFQKKSPFPVFRIYIATTYTLISFEPATVTAAFFLTLRGGNSETPFALQFLRNCWFMATSPPPRHGRRTCLKTSQHQLASTYGIATK